MPCNTWMEVRSTPDRLTDQAYLSIPFYNLFRWFVTYVSSMKKIPSKVNKHLISSILLGVHVYECNVFCKYTGYTV